MKTVSSFAKVAAALAATSVLLFSACTKNRDASSTTVSSTDTVRTAPASTTAMATTATWDSIKGYSYDQRAEFVAKTNAYAAQIEAKASTATGPSSARLVEARDQLKTAAADLNNASKDTWQAAKDRVGRAWQQTESAYRSAAE